MDLAEFLLARVAEDEALLHERETPQHRTHLYDALGSYSGRCPTCRQMIWVSRERGLAECEAKRRIVEMVPDLEGVLAALALPYADHPDYDPEWAVS